MMTEFADAANTANIPASFNHAALYDSTCDYPCPPDQAARWAPADRRWITFTGARKSSIADYEPGTEVFHDGRRLQTWAVVRHRGHLGPSIVYASLSNVGPAQELLTAARAPNRWWLATEGLGWLTAAQLSERLAQDYGVIVHPATIWAQQDIVKGRGYDVSRTFGAFR